MLTRTLETFLRHAGTVGTAAGARRIHRTTLYYRLDRIREITGVDLDDGDTRLMLHLGLTVRRLLALRQSEEKGGPGSSSRTW